MQSHEYRTNQWNDAERDCDQWAGDNQLCVSIVEDEAIGRLIVMPDDKAQEYLRTHDLAIIEYTADSTPETRACH
jgi:hypothetical protein